MKWLIVLLCILTGCESAEERPARATYNAGIAKLAKSEFEGAEKDLLAARSDAGVDPELRFRAAYNLGLAYAGHAENVTAAKPEDQDKKKKLELLQQAAWWFGDAARLRPDDKPTADNLAIVRARVQALSDELRKDEDKLEVRLDKLIEQQRQVLAEARGAWKEIAKAGGIDPLAQKDVMLGLADRSRGIVAEAGVISDVASDEIDVIAKKPEDQRQDQERSRLVQLKNLDGYIGEARARIAETRRELQELSADTALAKAEAALDALKRAREQLDDPIKVLQHVLADQAELDRQVALAAETAKPDKWLEYTAIAGRQTGLRDRVEEVRMQLQAATEAKPDKPDPQREKILERVRAALPHVADATTAQQQAHDAILDQKWKPAREKIGAAMLALFAAIEQFADLKHTVDLAWQKHQVVQKLLTDESVPDRAKTVHDELAGNLARIERIKGLIADELAAAQAKQPEPNADDKAKQALEQEKQARQAQLARAEELRAQAATQLAALEAAIAKPDKTHDPVAAAKTADATLYELRKLFFDVIEHLQELVREQAETRERTQTTGGQDDITREGQLPDLIARQDGHGVMAKSITDALAQQADAMTKQPQGAEQAQNVAQAADEVRAAGNDMSDAKATLEKAKTPQAQSVSLDPATKAQGSAIEHLLRALQLLQPPKSQDQPQDKDDKDNKNDKDDKDKDKKKNDQDQQQQQQQQQQSGPGQKAREDDAKRQKAKQDKPPADPVDEDW